MLRVYRRIPSPDKGRPATARPGYDPKMEFQLTNEDAEVLRHLASIEPLEARRYLQDRPAVAQRMTFWPPEIRIEVCRILYRSFEPKQRETLQARKNAWSDLIELLQGGD